MVDGRLIRRRDWDPDTQVSKTTQPGATSQERRTRYVSSYKASRGGGVSWPPVGMLSSRVVTDPILQVRKSPGPQTPKITAPQETASVLRERERPWLGVGRGCCTHSPTQPLPPRLHGVPAWCQEQGSDSGQQGPAGWKSLKQLETQEVRGMNLKRALCFGSKSKSSSADLLSKHKS